MIRAHEEGQHPEARVQVRIFHSREPFARAVHILVRAAWKISGQIVEPYILGSFPVAAAQNASDTMMVQNNRL